MDTNLIYMPVFRVRQQEVLAMKHFDFGDSMYPLLEIVKEKTRKNDQNTFEEIYSGLINSITAEKVFVDLPIYINQSGSVQDEVVRFSFSVINNLEKRVAHLNLFSDIEKVIPVISSYLLKTGEENTIAGQERLLRPKFNSIAFRIYINSFKEDFEEVKQLATENDFLIIDLDKLGPFKTPPIKPVVNALREFNKCKKILLRSAINPDIENVKLDHGQVVMEADNSQIDTDIMSTFQVNATGDYAGIKKDNLTAGGTISPGFLYYDAVENQYYGYKALIKGSVDEFDNTIIPAILASDSTSRMLQSEPPFLSTDNWGYDTLLKISRKEESGRSQAKFKRIAIEHYLYCMKILIEKGELTQTNLPS